MEKKKDITVGMYEDGDYQIFIVEKEDEFEAWFRHRGYAVMDLIFGLNKILGRSGRMTLEEFEKFVQKSLPSRKEQYANQYFDDYDYGDNDEYLPPEICIEPEDRSKPERSSILDGKVIYHTRPDGSAEAGIYLIDAPEEKDGILPKWRDAMYIGHNEQGWWYWMFGVRTCDMLTEDTFFEKLPEYKDVGCSEAYFDTVRELLGKNGYTNSDLKWIENAILGS